MFGKVQLYRYVFAIFIVFLFLQGNALSLTIHEEEELGREFMKEVRKRFELVEDPVINEYVNKVGRKIVTSFPAQPFKFRFHIIRENVLNAFAIPAGHVFIFSGLLENMESEDELAGILSHEISHVYCRHISRQYEQSKKIGIGTLAGIAAGVLLGGNMGSAMAISSMAAGQQLSLAFSREDELQADEIGLKYLTLSKYDGKGLLNMLRKIRARQAFGSDQIPTYLTTHPALEDRLANLDTLIQIQSKENAPVKQVGNIRFKDIHTRLQALYGDEKPTLALLKKEAEEDPGNPVRLHGYGLILARIGNRGEAIRQLKKALEKNAFDPVLLTDLSEVYFNDGQYSEAVRTVSSALGIDETDQRSLLVLGRSRMALGQFREAADIFEQLIKKMDSTELHYYLGEAYSRLGILCDAHYHLGKFYLAKKDPRTAMFHLKKAGEFACSREMKDNLKKMLKRTNSRMNERKKGSGSRNPQK